MTQFKGKAIYNPSGEAEGYSYWACNFFVGCSNGCTYCYCKKGILAGVMGQDKPQLKKCFKDEDHALELFKKELMQNLPELQKHGLFFTFTSDPMLPETAELILRAVNLCVMTDVPVKILTKCDPYSDLIISGCFHLVWMGLESKIAVGFTLTGHDELEPNASTNAERIEAMRKLHEAGFKTWASIEPIIDLDASFSMICRSMEHCDLFKIGLESGKAYDKRRLIEFMGSVCSLNHTNPYPNGIFPKIYFKDGLLKQAGITRESLPENCVNRDYDIFNH